MQYIFLLLNINWISVDCCYLIFSYGFLRQIAKKKKEID